MTFVAIDSGAPCRYDIVPSPVGRLLLSGDGHALTGLYMLDAGARMPAAEWIRDSSAFTEAAAELANPSFATASQNAATVCVKIGSMMGFD